MALPAHPLHSEAGITKPPVLYDTEKFSKLIGAHPTLAPVSAESPCSSTRPQSSPTGQQSNVSTSPRASVSRTIASPLARSRCLLRRSPAEPAVVPRARFPPSSSSCRFPRHCARAFSRPRYSSRRFSSQRFSSRRRARSPSSLPYRSACGGGAGATTRLSGWSKQKKKRVCGVSVVAETQTCRDDAKTNKQKTGCRFRSREGEENGSLSPGNRAGGLREESRPTVLRILGLLWKHNTMWNSVFSVDRTSKSKYNAIQYNITWHDNFDSSTILVVLLILLAYCQ